MKTHSFRSATLLLCVCFATSSYATKPLPLAPELKKYMDFLSSEEVATQEINAHEWKKNMALFNKARKKSALSDPLSTFSARMLDEDFKLNETYTKNFFVILPCANDGDMEDYISTLQDIFNADPKTFMQTLATFNHQLALSQKLQQQQCELVSNLFKSQSSLATFVGEQLAFKDQDNPKSTLAKRVKDTLKNLPDSTVANLKDFQNGLGLKTFKK